MNRRAGWAISALTEDATAWPDRRERVLATPLADTPAEWQSDETGC
jgi:hypothetical protein